MNCGVFPYDREVWPAGDSFGAADAEPEEDFMALREILFADLGNSWCGALLSVYTVNQCCGSMTFWCGSGSESADPCL